MSPSKSKDSTGRLGPDSERGYWEALAGQDLPALELLLSDDFDWAKSRRDPASGRLPLDWCLFLHKHDSARALLAHGDDPDQKSQAGGQPLAHLAAKSHCEGCVGVLSEAGADWESEDASSFTPLVAACGLPVEANAMKSIEFLTAAGARPDTVTAAGFFALGMSALKNHALACQLLLAKGASVDLHRGDGFTALFYAIDNGAADAAKALLRAGADCDASAEVEIGEDERDRLDPMQLAALRGSMEVAAMIYAFKESKVLRAKIAAPAKKASVRL